MLHFWSWLLLVATLWFREVFLISSLRSCYWFLAPCIVRFFKTSKLAALSPWDCQKRVESHENDDRKAKLRWLLRRALQTVSNNAFLIVAYLIWSHSLLFSMEVNMTVLLFLLAGQKALKKSTVYPVLVHLLLWFISVFDRSYFSWSLSCFMYKSFLLYSNLTK